ncbi:PAS domain-containing sensor histidine kinase [Olleya sp. AS48]|uniref:sensor histidine kinase n=1 Tax=Olleya sp. AS48 TaxID=3135774 RepID=UPI003173A0EE
MSELIKGILNNQNSFQIRNENWESTLEISKVGIWDFCASSQSVFFSKPSKAIIGFENDDTFGQNINDWNDRVHPEDKEQYHKDFQEHINGIKPYYENKHRVKHKDGSYRWVLDRGKVIEKNKQGEASRFIGTHVDITKYALNELKVQETLDLVVKQNSKLQNFAHIVTHNLKQHAGNFESLLDFYKEAQTVSEKDQMMEYLITLSKSLSKTISNLNEIVTVQSKQKTDTEKLCINTEINNVLTDLNYHISENHALIHNNTTPDCFLNFNTSYFHSIIQNLVLNAIKYKHPQRHPEIHISSTCTEQSIEIQITDNGCGIDLKKFGKDIFGLYKTFHKNHDSEGVGLYLVKNQIEAFGGTITVESTVNLGTTFTITLPN